MYYIPRGNNKVLREVLWRQQNYMCNGWERLPHAITFRQAVIDHYFPKAFGGSHHISNLQVLCRPCNKAKGNAVPTQHPLG